ncbi:A/G-specific adenine glycosylase, partial [Streptomyces sp. SID625]|nr:A/G-specific adenine glycosylase [Streptomyces sp. SID625]
MTAPTLPPHSTPSAPAPASETPTETTAAPAAGTVSAAGPETGPESSAAASSPVGAPLGETLHTQVITWFEDNARDLPWRRADAGAWGVMVSEFMLQQTPVSRVLPVYEQWLERWPR